MSDFNQQEPVCSKVVVASGYFNPLTSAHVQYLEAAAKLGTLLVVVNSDAQYRLKAKDEGRRSLVPFMCEQERLAIVKALGCVYQACLSYSLEFDRSISQTLAIFKRSIGCDIFVNGGDVTLENCRERKTCEELGIQMMFGVGGQTKVQSSSWLIDNAVRNGLCVPPDAKCIEPSHR